MVSFNNNSRLEKAGEEKQFTSLLLAARRSRKGESGSEDAVRGTPGRRPVE